MLFGGVDDLATTWLWDGAAWTRAHPAMSPPGRYGAFAAFDPQIGEVLLFGGTLQTGQNASDTWGWDGRTWTVLDSGGGEPSGGGGSNMAWDASLSEMVLATPPSGGRGGGETWVWNGARWMLDVPGTLGMSYVGMLIAFDPLSNSLMAEGCCQSQSNQVLGGLPSTWRWNGSAWSPLATSRHPQDGSSLAVDPSLGRLVPCGCDLGNGLGPEMWVWDGRDWLPGQDPRPPVAPRAAVGDPRIASSWCSAPRSLAWMRWPRPSRCGPRVRSSGSDSAREQGRASGGVSRQPLKPWPSGLLTPVLRRERALAARPRTLERSRRSRRLRRG